MPTPAKGPSLDWKQICELDPGVVRLYERARAIRGSKRNRRFCAIALWYDYFRPLLVHRVGWQASNPELQSAQAYSIAYDKIFNVLPPCRNCPCLVIRN